MLVLKRNVEEEIMIGSEIRVLVTQVGRGWVRIGIEAPPELPVHRREVFDAIRRGEGRDGKRSIPHGS